MCRLSGNLWRSVSLILYSDIHRGCRLAYDVLVRVSKLGKVTKGGSLPFAEV